MDTFVHNCMYIESILFKLFTLHMINQVKKTEKNS